MDEVTIKTPENIDPANLSLVGTSTGQTGTFLTFEHRPEYNTYYQYHMGNKVWRKITVEE